MGFEAARRPYTAPRTIIREGAQPDPATVDACYGGGEEALVTAARIRAHAEPGEILVSAEVADAIRNQPHIETSPRGEHKFKNVGRPVTVYSVSRSE